MFAVVTIRFIININNLSIVLGLTINVRMLLYV